MPAEKTWGRPGDVICDMHDRLGPIRESESPSGPMLHRCYVVLLRRLQRASYDFRVVQVLQS
jgi:hypothetical protein